MMNEAFFPEITYLSPGDEVIFLNLSGQTRDITAGEDSWLVQDLADGAQASLIVSDGMPTEYKTVTAEGDIIGGMNFSGDPNATEND